MGEGGLQPAAPSGPIDVLVGEGVSRGDGVALAWACLGVAVGAAGVCAWLPQATSKSRITLSNKLTFFMSLAFQENPTRAAEERLSS
jgi:hypothetical protein